jgi:hypothetical protein
VFTLHLSSDVTSHLHMCAKFCMVDLTNKMCLRSLFYVSRIFHYCSGLCSVRRCTAQSWRSSFSPSLPVRQFCWHGYYSVILIYYSCLHWFCWMKSYAGGHELGHRDCRLHAVSKSVTLFFLLHWSVKKS